MARRRRGGGAAFGLWADLVASGVVAAVTLSVRPPQIASGTMTGAEEARMVGEKLAAAGEGLAAGIAAKRSVRPAPHLAMHDALEVVAAASRPARRRVKANAARLSRPR